MVVGVAATIPIGSMYGISTNIYQKNQPNVDKYTSPMDPMGYLLILTRGPGVSFNHKRRLKVESFCWNGFRGGEVSRQIKDKYDD